VTADSHARAAKRPMSLASTEKSPLPSKRHRSFPRLFQRQGHGMLTMLPLLQKGQPVARPTRFDAVPQQGASTTNGPHRRDRPTT
jgi:hypothetical protein